jgi:hypothetical protein
MLNPDLRYSVGTWVVVLYDKQWYPGYVTQVAAEEVEVNCL